MTQGTSSNVATVTDTDGHMFEEDYLIPFPRGSLSSRDQSFKSMGFEDYQE